MDQLFERFYRVDKHRSRATGGSGLGLAISQPDRRDARRRDPVESEVGSGSTFKMRLPKVPISRSASYAI